MPFHRLDVLLCGTGEPVTIDASDSACASRSAIEYRIQKYTTAIQYLKTQLNAHFVAISKLPPEILAEVLIFYAEGFREKFEAALSKEYWGWTAVLSVCAHWRAVALGCPRLWSTIVVTYSTDWMSQVLQRSRNAPLTVIMNLGSAAFYADRSKAFALVMRHLPRIRSIRLNTGRNTLEEALKGDSLSAPLLQSLVIVSTPVVRSHGLIAPPNFLADGQFGALRRLELQDFPFSWKTSTPLSTLRHLKLNNVNRDATLLMPDMLSTLEQMSLLETLELRNCLPTLPSDADDAPPTTRQVELSHLNSLLLAGQMLECTSLLNHLALPSGVVYKFQCTGLRGADNLAAALATKISADGPIRFYSVKEISDSLQTRIRGSLAESLDPYVSYLDTDIPYVFELTFGAPFGALPQQLAAFCAGMPLSGVNIMEVSSLYLSANHWQQAFTEIKSLEKLIVSGSATQELPAVLGFTDTDYEDVDSENKRFFIHDIDTLELNSARFAEIYEVDEEQMGGYTELLLDCLMERSGYGAGICTLVLNLSINLSTCDREMLQEVVPSLTWDKMDHFEEEYTEESEDEYDDEFNDLYYDDFPHLDFDFWDDVY